MSAGVTAADEGRDAGRYQLPECARSGPVPGSETACVERDADRGSTFSHGEAKRGGHRPPSLPDLLIVVDIVDVEACAGSQRVRPLEVHGCLPTALGVEAGATDVGLAHTCLRQMVCGIESLQVRGVETIDLDQSNCLAGAVDALLIQRREVVGRGNLAGCEGAVQWLGGGGYPEHISLPHPRTSVPPGRDKRQQGDIRDNQS